MRTVKPMGNGEKITKFGLGNNGLAATALDSMDRQTANGGHGFGNPMVMWAILALAREVRLGLHEVAQAIVISSRGEVL